MNLRWPVRTLMRVVWRRSLGRLLQGAKVNGSLLVIPVWIDAKLKGLVVVYYKQIPEFIEKLFNLSPGRLSSK